MVYIVREHVIYRSMIRDDTVQFDLLIQSIGASSPVFSLLEMGVDGAGVRSIPGKQKHTHTKHKNTNNSKTQKHKHNQTTQKIQRL